MGTTGAAAKLVQAELVARGAGCPVCRHLVEPTFDRRDLELGHDASLYAGGSATLSVTDDCRGRGGDGTTMELGVPAGMLTGDWIFIFTSVAWATDRPCIAVP